MSSLTQSLLREALDYNPETGVFTWRERPVSHFSSAHKRAMFNTQFAGAEAGSLLRGYVRITLFDKRYPAHRLAWLYVHGEHAPLIDHINGITSDNRIANIRACTPAENSMNRSTYSSNSTGVTGVSYCRRGRKRWRVYAAAESKDCWLGHYDNLFDAVCARKSAEMNLGFHPNHGRAAGKRK